jgi:hypothetical protein
MTSEVFVVRSTQIMPIDSEPLPSPRALEAAQQQRAELARLSGVVAAGIISTGQGVTPAALADRAVEIAQHIQAAIARL